MSNVVALFKEPVVAEDVAESEFQRWVDTHRMTQKLDPARLDGEDRKTLLDQKLKLIDAIQRGELVVNESGQFVYTPPGVDPITFKMPVFALVRQSLDKFKDGQNGQRMLFLLTASTGTGGHIFDKMEPPEFQVCQAVLNLFLG
jgi:hypothetical protein